MNPADHSETAYWLVALYVALMVFLLCGGLKLLADKPPQRPVPRRWSD